MNNYIHVYTREDGIKDGVLKRLREYFREDGLDVDETIAKIRWTPGRFVLGELVITSAAAAKLETASVIDTLIRHQLGDWGDLEKEDCERNEEAVKDGARVFSAYWGDAKNNRFEAARFYIITEWNREATTILLPEDY